MKKCNKNYFNMVEIVLALAVVAIAIVSLMGILPVALKASKESVENNKVQAVQYLMKAYIDSYYEEYKKPETNSANPVKTFKNNFLNYFYNEKQFGALTTNIPKVDSENDLIFKLPSNKSEVENYALRVVGFKNDLSVEEQKGIFLVEFFSGEFKNGEFERTDAAYNVRLWFKPFEGILNVPYHMPYDVLLGGGQPAEFKKNIIKIEPSSSDDGLEYGCTFYLEISFPAGASYSKQEHKLFKYDYFRSVD